MDRDGPDRAAEIELSGGVGGPAVSMFVWPDHRGGYGPHFGGWGSGDDYGWGGWYGGGVAGPGATVLWSATRRRSLTPRPARSPSSFRPAQMELLASRQMPLGGFISTRMAGAQAELLAEGHLHVRPMVSRAITPVIMLTDTNPAVP